MDEWSKALAAINAIYNLLDRDSTSLKQDFDDEAQEHIITLEFRCRDPRRSSAPTNVVAEEGQYVPLLHDLLGRA